MHIITPLEKAKHEGIIIFSLYFFKYIGIIPINVEIPAKNVIIKLNVILFMINIMLLLTNKLHICYNIGIERDDIMNYSLLMDEQIKHIKDGATILLHACCAPCSSSVLEQLGDIFKITILFYNPNITEEDEYIKRLDEIKNFISKFKTKYSISLVEGRYLPEEFLNISKGLENTKERGPRCFKCYKLRLEETAKIAEKEKFDYFSTTLTLSPYKNSDWVNAIGEDLNKQYNSKYLYSDFKKHNGYKRSIELSNEYNLYRQDYCGCIYSKKERDIKINS